MSLSAFASEIPLMVRRCRFGLHQTCKLFAVLVCGGRDERIRHRLNSVVASLNDSLDITGTYPIPLQAMD